LTGRRLDLLGRGHGLEPAQGGDIAAHAATLGLPVRGSRLHIHPFEGSGDGLCGSFHRPKEPITVTHTEIIYRRRVALLALAKETGNVAAACRSFGVSRTR
jgi:hypothetical protein